MSTARFQHVMDALSSEPLDYLDPSSPRRRVQDKIYTSTEYPADQWIFLHNENSYSECWPGRVFFYCETPPTSGGETPLADCRAIYRRLDPGIVRRFAEHGVMYVRNFQSGFGLSWQTVFQSNDRAVVEAYCRRHGLHFTWKDGGRLRTVQVRRAVARHPKTGETVWFNHAAFFHISTLEDDVRRALLEEVAEDDLPYNTYYGDGSPIEAPVLEELRAQYRAEMVRFPWRQGDMLVLDNMLTAHGRAPFTGPRRVLVGMADPVSDGDTG